MDAAEVLDDDAAPSALSRPLLDQPPLDAPTSTAIVDGGGRGGGSLCLEPNDEGERRRIPRLLVARLVAAVSIAALAIVVAMAAMSSRATDCVVAASSRTYDAMGYLNVSWICPNHPRDPGEPHYIAVHCPPDADDGDFVDRVAIDGTVVAGTVPVGPLPNYRAPCQFRYAVAAAAPDGSSSSRSWGRSGVVEPRGGYDEPTSVRLSFGADDRRVMVQWVSGSADTPAVIYGTDRERVMQLKGVGSQPEGIRVRTGHSTTYRASDMCAAPATSTGPGYYRDPGHIHRVYLDVVPDTKYYYRVGSVVDGPKSELYSFLSPLADGQGTRLNHDRTSFFVFGDMDVSKEDDRSRTTVLRIADDISSSPEGQYAGIVHIGDLGYALGKGYVWDLFGAQIQPISSSIPYMVGVGNHEYAHEGGYSPVGGNYGNESYGECGVPYVHRFATPLQGDAAPGAPSYSPYWYSFRSGRTFHVVISTEHDYTPGSEMHEWFETELNSVDRAATPWLFVHGHRPMYSSQNYTGDYNTTLLIRSALEPMMSRYAVDAYFSGHYHSYERTCRVHEGRCLDGDEGTLHVTVGTGGFALDIAGYYNKSWSVATFQMYGYSRLHVYNDTVATIEFVQNHDGTVLDSVTLVSNHVWGVKRPSF